MAGNYTTTVRMYNVGFGDAFLVTVTGGDRSWRMLIDCGVHSQGEARPIETVVRAIIDDLGRACTPGKPHLDVLVATHHHADHISGFSLPDWEDVVVDEVWLPYVEDDSDPDAATLRLTDAARSLLSHIERRTRGLAADEWPPMVTEARAFAFNSLGNAKAIERLTGAVPTAFANRPTVRYLPYKDETRNVLDIGLDGVTVHVLGPSRDPAHLKRMNPPTSAGWLQLDDDADDDDEESRRRSEMPLFKPSYIVDDAGELPKNLFEVEQELNLAELTNDAGLLAAASILERSVNNTSLFLVLDVAGTRLIFPGDAQQGAWDHVLDEPHNRALLADAAFYKIGHHGSHNATPKEFVTDIWHQQAHAMLPWGLVPRWKNSIPKRELLDELHARHHTLVRADSPQVSGPEITVHEDLWSQIEVPSPPLLPASQPGTRTE